jgi:hypothetical protein
MHNVQFIYLQLSKHFREENNPYDFVPKFPMQHTSLRPEKRHTRILVKAPHRFWQFFQEVACLYSKCSED